MEVEKSIASLEEKQNFIARVKARFADAALVMTTTTSLLQDLDALRSEFSPAVRSGAEEEIVEAFQAQYPGLFEKFDALMNSLPDDSMF